MWRSCGAPLTKVWRLRCWAGLDLFCPKKVIEFLSETALSSINRLTLSADEVGRVLQERLSVFAYVYKVHFYTVRNKQRGNRRLANDLAIRRSRFDPLSPIFSPERRLTCRNSAVV